MKKHVIFLLFLIIFGVLTVGCTNENQPPQQQGVRTDQDLNREDVVAQNEGVLSPPTTSVVEVTQQIPVVTSVVQTLVQSQDQKPAVPDDTLCGELVFCGELPANSGVKSVQSTRCAQLNNQVVHHDHAIIQCFRDTYQGTGVNNVPLWNVEYIKLLCKKGIGTPGYCEKFGATLIPKERPQ